ncbi:MAG: DUF1565 domain-containing protein [Cyanobacteria bacterium P01_D01_bin.6]
MWSGLDLAGHAITPDEPHSRFTGVPATIAQAPGETAEYTVLHVSASSGNDTSGDGSQLRPYKTITHALSLAEANSLILLARGTYSGESGENFPLQLRSGVTIQGMTGPNTADVVIQGSGNYYSHTTGMQPVALLGADNAGLAKVTVSNPHREGIGLWIESGSPIVLDSAFLQNGAAGIHIAGPGAPVIRGNYFSNNGRAGLIIAGPSTAKVEANVFENTGVGITVAPGSAPEILNNRISGNLDGLLMHAEARPRLQGNQIARNRRNSIVDYAIWTMLPPVRSAGATQPPPPNVTSGGSAASVEDANIPAPPLATAPVTPSPTAVVSVIDRSVTASEVPPEDITVERVDMAPPPESTDTAATSTPAASFTAVSEVTLGDRLPQDIDATVNALNETDISFLPAIASVTALNGVDLIPVMEVTQSLSDRFADETMAAPATGENPTESLDIDLFAPLPSPGETEPTQPSTVDPSASPAPSEVINLPVIPSPVETPTKPLEFQASRTALIPDVAAMLITEEQLPAVPTVATASPTLSASNRLAVPNREIPIGSGGSLPEAFTAGAAANLPSDGPPPPPTLANSLGLIYKVLVTAPDEATQAAVRSQVPDAFRTQVNGQLFMQAGAYPTMTEAQAQRDQLQQAGLPAQVQEIR